MPAATPKRVKNVRISRPFVIGSDSWDLTDANRKPDTPPDHTKAWKVYVKGTDNGPNVTAWLKKVQFKIFHTYNNPVRVVEEPPFEVQETGWGGFVVDVKLFFTPEASAKPETRTHFLQLEPYGDDELKARQVAEKRVKSEFLDVVEFNEPPEALYNILTGDEQWQRAKTKGKGKGSKGKGRGGGATVDPDGTVELPDAGDRENPFTKENEKNYVEMLEGKVKELEAVKAAEDERARKVAARLEELRARQRDQGESAVSGEAAAVEAGGA